MAVMMLQATIRNYTHIQRVLSEPTKRKHIMTFSFRNNSIQTKNSATPTLTRMIEVNAATGAVFGGQFFQVQLILLSESVTRIYQA